MAVATNDLQPVDMQAACVVDRDGGAAAEEQMRAKVRGLLCSLYPRGNVMERRGEQRFPFPYLMHLTPVTQQNVAQVEESVVVTGKHISEHGLSFYHNHPLPNRRMIVSVEMSNGAWLGVLIDLTWCRFTKHGWYESGGRFLRLVDLPVEMQ